MASFWGLVLAGVLLLCGKMDKQRSLAILVGILAGLLANTVHL
jgi:hypothetical protein